MDKVLGARLPAVLFVAPALLLYTLVMLVPTVWSAGFTLYEGEPIGGFTFVGVDNYRRLVGDPELWASTAFTLKYAAVVTVGQVGAGLALALLYVFFLKGSSALVRTLAFLPVVLPTTAVAQMFIKMFELAPQNGLVNSVVAAGGGEPVDWLGSPTLAFLVIVLMDVWRSMGFYAVLLYAGLVEVPEDVVEAARIDGAQGLTLVGRVVLPLLRPIVFSAIVFSLNGTLKVFDSVYALTRGGPDNSMVPLTLSVITHAFQYMEYGYGSTIAMALTVLCLLVTLSVFRSARKDVTA